MGGGGVHISTEVLHDIGQTYSLEMQTSEVEDMAQCIRAYTAFPGPESNSQLSTSGDSQMLLTLAPRESDSLYGHMHKYKYSHNLK